MYNINHGKEEQLKLQCDRINDNLVLEVGSTGSQSYDHGQDRISFSMGDLGCHDDVPGLHVSDWSQSFVQTLVKS